MKRAIPTILQLHSFLVNFPVCLGNIDLDNDDVFVYFYSLGMGYMIIMILSLIKQRSQDLWFFDTLTAELKRTSWF